MNRYVCLILSIFILSFVAKAGDVARIPPEYNIFLLFQGYTINAYNATGFSNALYSTISDLPDANPASLTDYEKPAIGLSMEYHTGIDQALIPNLDGIGHSRDNQYLPQSFAAIYPFQSFQVGLGFYQKYSGKVEFGLEPIVSPQDPEGIGQFYEPEFTRNIYSGNIIISKKFNKIFGSDHQISAGSQLNLDYFKGKEKISTLEVAYSDEAFSWKLGIRYSYQNLLNTAVIFDKGSSFSGKIKYNHDFLVPVIQDTSLTGNNISIEQEEEKFKSTTPDRLILGYELKSLPWLWISGSTNLVYWHGQYNTMNNNLDYSVNFIINGKEKYSYSVGYFNTDTEVFLLTYGSAINYEAHFLSGGFRARLESMAIYVTIMDSHLSTKTRRQTIGKLGFEYQF